QGVFHLQGGATKKNELSRRIIGTNAHLYLGLYFNNSIEEIIKFVIQQLSTIKVVPDDLFESYRNNNSFIENDKLNKTPLEIRNSIDRRNKKINDSYLDIDLSKDEIEAAYSKKKNDLIKQRKDIIDKITKF